MTADDGHEHGRSTWAIRARRNRLPREARGGKFNRLNCGDTGVGRLRVRSDRQ